MQQLQSTEDASNALASACKAGQLAEAYRVLVGYRLPELAQIALQAGFSCISMNDRSPFMQHLQHQIAEAARRRVDGFGLRLFSQRG